SAVVWRTTARQVPGPPCRRGRDGIDHGGPISGHTVAVPFSGCRTLSRATRADATTSVDRGESPGRHIGGKPPRVVHLWPDHVAQTLQDPAPEGDVVILAAGVARQVVNGVEPVRLLDRLVQLPPVRQVNALPVLEVLTVGAVEGEHVADDRARREAV